MVWSKSLQLPGKDEWCEGSPVGAGYVLKSGSVLSSYNQGTSSAPFDVLCQEACEQTADCGSAHVFLETFE